MKSSSSRRSFLAGLALPAAGIAATSSTPSPLSSPAGSPAAEPKLTYRTLGKTGLKVTSLGVGCMLASDPAVLEYGCDVGLNYFESARGYQHGNNERMVGVALKGKRDKVVLATKSGATTKAEMLEELETSLKELGTDYLDVWYMHNKYSPDAINDEMLEAQEAARKAGKIRFRGLSFHFNMPQMIDHAVELGCIDVVLTTYNFIVGDEVGNAIKRARESGVGIVAMKIMGGGYTRIKKGDRAYGADNVELEAKLRKPNAMLAALKYAMRNESVDVSMIAMRSFEDVDEDVRAMSEPYSDADEKLLAQQRQDIRHLYCHQCGECSGVCEKGVRVADTQRQLMYAEGYGEFTMARDGYRNQPASARSVSCEDCSTCSVQCPNGLEVQANMIRAQKLFG